MNFIDNGDGTYTDQDTGNLYDAALQPLVAVPNQSPLEFQNVSAVTPDGTIDTVASAASVSTVQPSSPLGSVDQWLHAAESGLTNLALPLIRAKTASATAGTANVNASIAANSAAASAQADTDNKKMIITAAVILLVLVIAYKTVKS